MLSARRLELRTVQSEDSAPGKMEFREYYIRRRNHLATPPIRLHGSYVCGYAGIAARVLATRPVWADALRDDLESAGISLHTQPALDESDAFCCPIC